MPRPDEHGYRWTRHRSGAISAPVHHGAIMTKAMVSEWMVDHCFATIHGTCINNPEPMEGKSPYDFPSVEAAQAALREQTTPR